MCSSNFYVWGGFNGVFPTELSILNLDTFKWSTFEQDLIGRAGIASSLFDRKIYGYGGSKNARMVVMDLENCLVTSKPTCGTQPPSLPTGSGMVAVGNYLLFFGGGSTNEFVTMYACDTANFTWFVFHVRPDEVTVSIDDGRLDGGVFLMPELRSFSWIYVREKGQVVAFLGEGQEQGRMWTVSVGEALPVVNLQQDLLTALLLG
jgi:hypothetical protein